ncbi:mce associated transmembrane protein [Mycobacterium tuberculosis]|nr:mce associated transmembrane protein [Mycobacterium tuberculosis]
MTVVVEKTPTTLPQATPNGAAPWHVRAGAFAIDVLPGLAVAARHGQDDRVAGG